MRGYLDTSWGQLHYESTGSGEKTIVLFHETGVDYSAYQHLVPELAPHLRVIAFDTPGCGQSDPPPRPANCFRTSSCRSRYVSPVVIHRGASSPFR